MRPTISQVDDIIAECREVAAEDSVLDYNFDQEMAEDLSEYSVAKP